MSKYRYQIEAATTAARVHARQCDAVGHADTLKEAKAKARYMLTQAYQQACDESSEPLGYARVMRLAPTGFTCVADFHHKV